MKHAKQLKLVAAIKEELFKMFGDEEGSEYYSERFSLTRKMVDKDVRLPSEDTGQNAPDSLCVVYTEGYIPGPYNSDYPMADEWNKVLAAVNKKGFDVNWEAINGGCVAFYE